MKETLTALAVADASAVNAFVSRQSVADMNALVHGSALMRDVFFQIQLTRPAELHAWKTPAMPDAVPVAVLQKVLNAAVSADRHTLVAQGERLAFGQLATLQSLACFIADSARREIELNRGAP